MEAAESTAAALAQSDLDLVERHRYGDPAAFEEVYRRYGEMVYSLCHRLSGDPDLAADLTQEAFLRIFRHVGKFRGGSSLKTWVYRVALNHCRSRLARRRLFWRSLAEPDEPGPEAVDPGRSPEDRAIAHDEGRRLTRALAAVPVAYREAVVLFDLQGLSYEEIARVLGVRLGTVRSRLARGRERLRQILEEGEPLAPESSP
ncbi:MAG: sigma-70 family RNA polymerase sigma factor [Acidobacteria bacterium]|nr:sigma-70 family RNA polymerase sigma factor [Acidobacteriota bacterium]